MHAQHAKADNHHELIKSLQLDPNKYYRYLCIDKYKSINFSKYPINLKLCNIFLNWLRIYENIVSFMFNAHWVENDIDITDTDLYISCNQQSELFLLLLWDFNNFYNTYFKLYTQNAKCMINPGNKMINFKYTKILYEKLNKNNKTPKHLLYFHEILDNFNSYIPIYINNIINEQKIVPYYNNNHIDKDGYIIKISNEKFTDIFICTHKLVDGNLVEISPFKKDSILVSKDYSNPSIMF
jgi:hypothetical protein